MAAGAAHHRSLLLSSDHRDKTIWRTNLKTGFIALALCLVVAITISAAPPQAGKSTAKDPKAALIARGKYLVGAAGQCGDCHTPSDKKGRPIASQALQGAPILFKPTVPVPNWAEASMPIAGLPSMPTEEEAITFFMTGKHSDGRMAAPPMPQYRFNRKDAEAIVAYLKSLGQ
jgi:mono/diheme cytochrome c family protein